MTSKVYIAQKAGKTQKVLHLSGGVPCSSGKVAKKCIAGSIFPRKLLWALRKTPYLAYFDKVFALLTTLQIYCLGSRE
jgi:hypothetical protein